MVTFPTEHLIFKTGSNFSKNEELGLMCWKGRKKAMAGSWERRQDGFPQHLCP